MQVVEQLGSMLASKRFNRLDLQNDLAVYYKICEILPNYIAFVRNSKRHIVAGR